MVAKAKMTAAEAQCFRAARARQRRMLWRSLARSFVPRSPLTVRGLSVATRVLLTAVLLPGIVVWWLLFAFAHLLWIPLRVVATYIRPRALRSPGERNLQGMHYSYSRFFDLPPDEYLKCVDDWTQLLYGAQKLPEYSIKNYLDYEHLFREEILSSRDKGVTEYLHQQIKSAREDLSRDLGYYS